MSTQAMRLRLNVWQRAGAALAVVILAAAAPSLLAARDVLKVCQDPGNLPFSNEKGEGFENRIAELLAQKLGWKLEYFSFPQRMGFIRNTLRFKLPGEDYRCDLVIGVPAKWDQVAPTKPYYRSTYALVYPQGGKLEGVHTARELYALDPNKLHRLRIGVYDRSPATEWLNKHGLADQGVPYRMMNADPEYYPGQIIEKDLAAGTIDAAVVWGPIAGFFAKRSTQPKMIVVPLPSEPGVDFDYEIAMGVRRGEAEWKATVERLIDQNRDRIEQILREYGVPLLDAQGNVKS
jgi:quinoprotein dehydrogenase-associated probable ABC transporter substrate-binding protein